MVPTVPGLAWPGLGGHGDGGCRVESKRREDKDGNA